MELGYTGLDWIGSVRLGLGAVYPGLLQGKALELYSVLQLANGLEIFRFCSRFLFLVLSTSPLAVPPGSSSLRPGLVFVVCFFYDF